MPRLLCQGSYIKILIKDTIINTIIDYNYAQHPDVAVDDILARNLFESSDFGVRSEVMLRNAFSEFFHYSRDSEV